MTTKRSGKDHKKNDKDMTAPRYYHKNPRTLSEMQHKRLAEDLEEFGDLGGIVHDLNSNELVGGNQRSRIFDLATLQPIITQRFTRPTKQGTVALGYVEWKGERFGYRAVKWTPKKCEAANIKANLDGGSWDFDVLANEFEIADLQAWGFDKAMLDNLNREQAALIDLLASEEPDEPADAEPQTDRAEELLKKWKVKRGDMFAVGSHRLLCGDSTVRADVERVMGGEKVDCLLTDPPYGMDLDTDWSAAVGSLKSIGRQRQTTGNKYEQVIGDDKPFDAKHLFDFFGSSKEMFLFGADYYAETIPDRNNGSWLVWDKRKESQAEAIGSEFELIWSKGKHKRRMLRHDWFGFLSSQNTKEARDRLHPTQKPTSLIQDMLTQWTSAESVVVDCYAGSGTTGVACQNLNRKARMIEISPAYCAVILQRMTDSFPDLTIELLD